MQYVVLCAGVSPPVPEPRRAGAPPDGQPARAQGEGGVRAAAAAGGRGRVPRYRGHGGHPVRGVRGQRELLPPAAGAHDRYGGQWGCEGVQREYGVRSAE